MRRKAKIDFEGYYVMPSGERSHFNVRELQCRCGCGAQNVDETLIELLEKIRAHFGGAPMFPNSGVRCWTYNKKVGGASASMHLPRGVDGIVDVNSGNNSTFGRACDFTIKGKTPREVQAAIMEHRDKLGVKGLGCYKGFTHVDVRDRMSTWRG